MHSDGTCVGRIGNIFRWSVRSIPMGHEGNDATDRSGFTFIEVLMAVSILALLLVGIHKLQSQLVDVNQAARFLTLAPLLAQNRMAELERSHFADIEKDTGDFGRDFPGYSWSLIMETMDTDVLKKMASPMKKIEISISLNKGERIYRLRTYRAVSDPAETSTRIAPTGLS